MKRIIVRTAVFCSRYYFALFALSVLLLLALSFHKVPSLLKDPITTEGTVVKIEETVYVGGRYGRISIKTQIIDFGYEGHSYRIRGGSDEAQARLGRVVQVIFPRAHPELGAELSIEGLLDWKLAAKLFYMWLIIAGSLLALARLNRHFRILPVDHVALRPWEKAAIFAVLILLPVLSSRFITFSGISLILMVSLFWDIEVEDYYEAPDSDRRFFIFKLHIPRLTYVSAVVIGLLLFLTPLLPQTKMILTGVRTQGIVTDSVAVINGTARLTATFAVHGLSYHAHVDDSHYDDKSMVGATIPIIYDEDNVNNSSVYTLRGLYDTRLVIPVGILAIFVLAWLLASKVPVVEGYE